MRKANGYLGTAQFVVIKNMDRVSALQHHIIGNIGEIIDRFKRDAFRILLHPLR